MSLTVAGQTAEKMRWIAHWSGAWVAEITLIGDVVPSGRVPIVSDVGIALMGTVDEARSGTFGEKRFVRVVAGAGAWSRPVRPQAYHADLGVRLAEVVTTTAAEVGETVVVMTPKVVGVDFARRAAEASQVFADAGVGWWVGFDGVTRVGDRPPVVAHASLVVLDWDSTHGTVSFTCDVLVEPGTVIVDQRFGQRIVRDVEADVSEGSVTGTLHLVEASPKPGAVSELVDSMGAMARRATRIESARLYEYRVVAMEGTRVVLQAVSEGVPDLLPTSVWGGASGYRATLRPSSRVLVGFREGVATKPFVAFYEPPEEDGWRPVSLELDALVSVLLGEQASAVTLGTPATALPVARAPAISAFASALQAAVTATAASATASGPAPVTGATLGGWLGTLAAAIGTAATALGTSCPSSKVRAS